MEVGDMRKLLASLLMLILIFSFMYSCGEQMTKEQLFALAEKYEQEENFNEAVNTYKKFLAKYTETERADEAQSKMALIYSNNLNLFEESINAHKELIEKYPESKYASQSLFMIGFIFANNIKDLDKAKEYYNKFLEKYPENELSNSVSWELKHLGQDINDIEFLNTSEETQKAE